MTRPDPLDDPMRVRDPQRERASLTLGPDMPLALARVHECSGSARHAFGIWVAMLTRGPVMWITQRHRPNRLNPDGMAGLVEPGRFLLVTPERARDLLWCMEEALRSGAVPLGLILTPGAGGAPGVETRWQFDPGHTPDREEWHLTRLRARNAPVRSWAVALNDGILTPRPG